jgi:hypothetical protein
MFQLRLYVLNLKRCSYTGNLPQRRPRTSFLGPRLPRYQLCILPSFTTKAQPEIPSYELNSGFTVTPFIVQYPDIYQIKRERFGRVLERFKQLYEAPIFETYYQYVKEKEKAVKTLRNQQRNKMRSILRKLKKIKKDIAKEEEEESFADFASFVQKEVVKDIKFLDFPEETTLKDIEKSTESIAVEPYELKEALELAFPQAAKKMFPPLSPNIKHRFALYPRGDEPPPEVIANPSIRYQWEWYLSDDELKKMVRLDLMKRGKLVEEEEFSFIDKLPKKTNTIENLKLSVTGGPQSFDKDLVISDLKTLDFLEPDVRDFLLLKLNQKAEKTHIEAPTSKVAQSQSNSEVDKILEERLQKIKSLDNPPEEDNIPEDDYLPEDDNLPEGDSLPEGDNLFEGILKAELAPEPTSPEPSIPQAVDSLLPELPEGEDSTRQQSKNDEDFFHLVDPSSPAILPFPVSPKMSKSERSKIALVTDKNPLCFVFTSLPFEGKKLNSPFRCRHVKLMLKLSALRLPPNVAARFVELVGPRYDPETDIVTIVSRKKPNAALNKAYTIHLLHALLSEAWKADLNYVPPPKDPIYPHQEIIKEVQEAERERAEKEPYKASNLKSAIDSASKISFATFRFCPIANNYDEILQAKRAMILYLLRRYRIIAQEPQTGDLSKEQENSQ